MSLAYSSDAIFGHYVHAILRRANITKDHDRWLAHVLWTEEINAHGATPQEAVEHLRERLTQKIFDSIRRGGNLAVIDGIDLNGGSC